MNHSGGCGCGHGRGHGARGGHRAGVVRKKPLPRAHNPMWI
jgi:hypothetical protein